MDPSPDPSEQKRKLDEMIKRKQEVQLKKHANADPTKEVYRYEELIRDKTRKKTTKNRVFNNAFCVEIKEEEERVMNIIKEPTNKPELTWYEQVLEKERKMRREETRVAQDRLKMIDKRTRYAEIIREVLSPPSRARNAPEVMPVIRSLSKKEVRVDDKASTKPSEFSQKSEQVRTLRPRSLSRKELSPRFTGRSPFQHKTAGPTKPDLT